jgi:hypothetical protein
MNSRVITLSVAGVAAVAMLVLPPRAAADQASQVGTPRAGATPGQASEPQHSCASDDPALFWRCAQDRGKKFDPPRTANGRPDFSGYWRHATEAKEDLEVPWDNAARLGIRGRGREVPAGPGKSLVVDPPDGKLPIQPWAAAQRKENEAKYIDQNVHCFLSGVPRYMYEAPAYQFLQSPESITIMSEEAHAFRVIKMDSRPRLPQNVRLWLGDARGKGEGNTLVIETTNHNGRVFLDRRGTFYTNSATVTERFTMLDRNTIGYAATVDDPLVYTRPFTIAFMLTRHTTEGFEIWEDACHEGEANVKELYNLGFKRYPGITSEDVPALKGRAPASR